MKSKLILLFMLASVMLVGFARAEVMEVTIWKPLAGVPNSGPDTFESGLRAKEIQEKHGGEVSVARDMRGRMHFAVAHESWAAWNQWWNKLNDDPKNTAFWQEVNGSPTADQVDHYLLNVVASGKSGPVYEVFIWEPMPGQLERLLEAGVGAKAVHDKSEGVSVSVAVDRLQRMHYILQFEGWDAYAKYWDTPNPEFDAYMAKQNADPSGRLIKKYTGSNL